MSDYRIKEHTVRIVNVPDEMVKKIRADAIEECNKKLDELERNYQSCYGTKIIEMYADVYEDFRAWLKEQAE